MYKKTIEIEPFRKVLGLRNIKEEMVGFLLGMFGIVSSYKQGGLADHNSRSSLLMLT